jgi:predicted CXXCH cytochrome family protein
MALLERSRCYQESPNLTCITCHNPHEAEKPAATYSTKCLGCHEAKGCGEFARLGDKISENCIDCHMPVQSSKVIVSALNGKQVSVRVRNHWIRVYSNSGETQ